MAIFSVLDSSVNDLIDRIIFDVDDDSDVATLSLRSDGMIRIRDLDGYAVDVSLAQLKLAIDKAIELGWDKPKQSIAEE